MLTGFIREGVIEKYWAEVDQFNQSLERLSNRRLAEVRREDDLAKAKVVWKVVVFQQSIIHRIVMLGAGCTNSWNGKNFLAAILCIRAAMETCALVRDVEKKLQKLCSVGDFNAINKLIDKASFGTRQESWLKEDWNVNAIHTLECIRNLDKEIPGVLLHYEGLSDFCHPNYLGLLYSFGTIDHDTATVSFSDSVVYQKDIFIHIFTGMTVIELTELTINSIDKLMPRILELSDFDKAESEAKVLSLSGE